MTQFWLRRSEEGWPDPEVVDTPEGRWPNRKGDFLKWNTPNQRFLKEGQPDLWKGFLRRDYPTPRETFWRERLALREILGEEWPDPQGDSEQGWPNPERDYLRMSVGILRDTVSGGMTRSSWRLSEQEWSDPEGALLMRIIRPRERLPEVGWLSSDRDLLRRKDLIFETLPVEQRPDPR